MDPVAPTSARTAETYGISILRLAGVGAKPAASVDPADGGQFGPAAVISLSVQAQQVVAAQRALAAAGELNPAASR